METTDGVELHRSLTNVNNNPKGSYYFTDEKGRYLAHFLPSFAEDELGAKTNNVDFSVEELDEESKYSITVSLDLNWLLDPERVYPIRIDPSIVHDTEGEFDAGLALNRVESISGPKVQLVEQELPADIHTVGLWHMDETANDTCSGGLDVCDSSGNDYHGTEASTAIETSNQKMGAAARTYDANADNIATASLPAMSIFTYESWVKFSSASGGGNDNFMCQPTNDPCVFRFTDEKIYVYADGVEKISSNTLIADTNWHHVGIVADGANLSLYIDGVFDDSVAYTGSSANSAFYFGDNSVGTDTFAGSVDEVRISNTARTPEEIKQSAQKRPYATYISDSLDLTSGVSSIDDLQWAENGVATGDGETLYDDTSLVAQWNFNETSGITANNDAEGTSCGGTPANCDGTLTNFASTASQDQAAGTGWTSNNRRWGAGGLMFDGSNDFINLSSAGTIFNFANTTFTVEAWVRSNSTAQMGLFSKGGTNANLGYEIQFNAVNQRISFQWGNAGGASSVYASAPWNNGNWHHIAVIATTSTTVAANNNAVIYLDGTSLPTTATKTYVYTASSLNASIGSRDAGASDIFSGIIDSIKIYSRALTATEILSNYNSANIEFMTRTSADEVSWEGWKPTTGETQLDSMDSNPDSDYYTDSLLHFDGNDASTNFADEAGKTWTAAGNVQIDTAQKEFGTASGLFDGTGDYIDTPDHADFDVGSGEFTVDGWFKRNATGVETSLFGQCDNAGGDAAVTLYIGADNRIRASITTNGTWKTVYPTETYTDSNWHHIAFIRTGDTLKVAVDGTFLATTLDVTGITANNSTHKPAIGRLGEYASYYWNGWIDEFRFSKGVARWTSNFTPPVSPYDDITPIGIDISTDTITAIEGTGSEKLEIGVPQVDYNTVGLWHLDETGGTGAYIKDFSANVNHGTPTGTTVVKGFAGKARSFNGTSDRILVGDSTSLKPSNITIEAWIKTSTANRYIAHKYKTAASYDGYGLATSASGYVRCWVGGSAWTTGTTNVSDGKWHHIACTYNGSNVSIYVDGASDVTPQAQTANLSYAIDLNIGCYNAASDWFNGIIDELRISDVARSADEIAETYRAGRDHRISRTYGSTDVSTSSKLPFYIAADRPGTYLEATIGESEVVNGMTDSDVVGLWHLEEAAGSGAYIQDSSSYDNDGTPSGTTFVQGKIGKGRDFNGSSDIITVTDSSTLENLDALTIEAWIYPETIPNNYPFIAGKYGGTNTYWYWFGFDNSASNYLRVGVDDNVSATAENTSISISTSIWTHVVMVWDSNTDGKIRVYKNGQHVWTSSGATTGTIGDDNNNLLFGRDGSNGYFDGRMDEVRVSNIARTADEIRQSYEIGLRTHPITIDFAASLDSGGTGGLIADSDDKLFTTDATSFGLSQQGAGLYHSDKVIVRENYDGTIYVAQGVVKSITSSSGESEVYLWDLDSTFPSGGYTANASVFKWQREYFDITYPLDSHLNAVTNLVLRVTNGSEGRTVWVDDVNYAGYLTDPSASSNVSSTVSQYLEYMAIISTSNTEVTPYLSEVTLNYGAGPSMDQLMRHGMYFSGQTKQKFWWGP